MDTVAFWRAVRAGSAEECWPWTRARIRTGYGRVSFEGRSWISSRLAYRLAVGHIPDGLCVLHRCDNPPCCNPAHLFLGTQAENLADCRAKGRARTGVHRGESNGSAILTDADVLAVREAYSSGAGVAELARSYGLSVASIKRAICGQGWSHIGGAVRLGRISQLKRARQEAATALFRDGATVAEVAAAVGISLSGAYHLKSRYINRAPA